MSCLFLASGPAAEVMLLKVLVQLCVIIVAARLFGFLFRRIGQPIVVGEIFAGIILGPSLFGKIAPDLFHRVFDPAVSDVFTMLAQLGLIFLLFLIGLEFDFAHLKRSGRASALISIAGIVVPFTPASAVLGGGFGAGLLLVLALALLVIETLLARWFSHAYSAGEGAAGPAIRPTISESGSIGRSVGGLA